MATTKTINLDINTNAEQAANQIDDLNNSLKNSKKAYDAVLTSGDSYEKQLADINNIVKTVPLNVRDMNKQIQAYQSIALSAGRETPVGQKALKAASDLKDKYIDIQNETKRLADDHKNLRGAMEIGSTVVAGFGAVQGAIALTGVESEKLRETMTKLMAAQTVLNGLQQIGTALEKESAAMLLLKSARTKAVTAATAGYAAVTGTTTGALKAFRIALISTGIGAIIVGIGLLVANFDKVKNALGGVTDKFKSAGAGVKLLMIPLLPLIVAIDLVKKGLQALGIIESEEDKAKEERHQAEMKRIEAENEARKEAFEARQKQFDREIAMLEAEGKSSFELRQQKIADSIAIQKQSSKAMESVIKQFETYGKVVGQNTEVLKELKEELKEVNEDIKDQENQLEVNVKKNNREKAKSYKAYTDKRKKLAEERKKADQEALDAEIDAEMELFKKLDAVRLENKARLNTEEENELLEVANKYDVLESMAYDNAEALNEIEIARLNAENDIKLKYANEAYEAQKAIDDKAAADKITVAKTVADTEKKIQEAKISNAEAGINLIKDIAGENNKLQALAIAAESAVGIAKTIISTQAANAAAVAQGTALAIPTAGASVAAAAAAVTQNNISAGISIAASIAAAAKGISALGGGASAPSGDAPSDISGGGTVPNFNVVGDSGINQLAQLQQQPTQAYVVSGEVTTGQALDRNRITNATL
jgi:hypothetical protein